MKQTFSDLLRADPETLVGMLGTAVASPEQSRGLRNEQLAHQLGVNYTQLICGVGFNPAVTEIPGFIRKVGFSSVENLFSERNYRFIHDNYQDLSVNNVVDIYVVAGAHPEVAQGMHDLVFSRLVETESLLEGTINPILIGGYKLEIRNIYENGLASEELIASRLRLYYSVLRSISNELVFMLQAGVVSPERLLREAGVTTDEKAKLVFQGQIPVSAVAAYLAENEVPDAERARLLEVSTHQAAAK